MSFSAVFHRTGDVARGIIVVHGDSVHEIRTAHSLKAAASGGTPPVRSRLSGRTVGSVTALHAYGKLRYKVCDFVSVRAVLRVKIRSVVEHI